MSTELFPPASVAAKSPRLLWRERHGIELSHTDDAPALVRCWAWLRRDGNARNPHNFCEMDRNHRIGFGPTHEDAILDLSKRIGLHLWNEEDAALLHPGPSDPKPRIPAVPSERNNHTTIQ